MNRTALTRLQSNHHEKTAVVLLCAVLLSSFCRADTDTVASFQGGTVTRQAIDAEIAGSKAENASSDATTTVETLVVRRVLASRLINLPTRTVTICEERLDLRRARLAARELQNHVAEESRPSTEVVRAHYDLNKDAYRRPKSWRLSNILFRVPEGAPSKERASIRNRLETSLDGVRSEDEFHALARAESDSPSAIRGGRIGMVTAKQLIPEVAAVVKDLEPGEISEVIETEDGFTAIFCGEVRPARTPSFDEMRAGIATRLKLAAFDKAWAELDQELQRRAAPVIDAGKASSGADADIVLRIRSPGGPVTVSRATYSDWLSDRGQNPSRWTVSDHEAALAELTLVLGRAAEARRQGLTGDTAFLARQSRETEITMAECVMDHESRTRIQPPTDAQITAVYREKRGKLVEPTKRDLEILRLEIGPPDPAAQYRALLRHSNAIHSGNASLAEVAEALFSDGQVVDFDTPTGLTNREVNSLGRAPAEAVFASGVGKVIGPIQEKNHLMIIRVVAIHPSQPLTLEEATPRIRQQLERAKLREARESIRAEILAEAEIVYH